jgi:hypothetical protein
MEEMKAKIKNVMEKNEKQDIKEKEDGGIMNTERKREK